MKNTSLIISLIFTLCTWSLAQVQIGDDLLGEGMNDNFGRSIALSEDGSIMAVGGLKNTEVNSSNGRVVIYEQVNGAWIPKGNTIYADSGFEGFGNSIALSADGLRLAIGAPAYEFPGRILIYEFADESWQQLGSDIVENNELITLFGATLDISSDGNRIVMGAFASSLHGEMSGLCRAYEYDGIEWVQLGDDFEGVEYGNLGRSVAMSGVGNIVACSGGNFIRIFEWSGGEWNQLGAQITGEPYERIGTDVDLSNDGSRISVGSTGKEIDNEPPYVMTLEYDGDDWVPLGSLILGNLETRFGSKVSLSGDGDLLAVGAQGDGNITGYYGQTFLYQLIDGEWERVGDTINGGVETDFSGFDTVLSSDGNILAIGARGANDFFGRVRVYGDLVVFNDNSLDDLSNDIAIFPNPAKDYVLVRSDKMNILKISLMDIYGKRLAVFSNDTEVFISNLLPGVYNLLIETSNGVFTKKMVKGL